MGIWISIVDTVEKTRLLIAESGEAESRFIRLWRPELQLQPPHPQIGVVDAHHRMRVWFHTSAKLERGLRRHIHEKDLVVDNCRSKLTFEEAVQCWLLRARGMMRRTIWARFNVDPRRVYEVWAEEEHLGSRTVAIREFKSLYPGDSVTGRFDLHVPRHQVRRINPGQKAFEF